MKIRDIIEHLEVFAPPVFQEAYDNSGLITGNAFNDCNGVMICLDCTEEAVDEAIANNCNLIISHHPLIFRPIRNVSPDSGTGRTLIASIKSDIAVYAIHTNLDNMLSGVNKTIADKLGLLNRKILAPKEGFQGVGSGMIGDLAGPCSELDFLGRLREAFKTPVIRHSPLSGRVVNRIALCGGAGSFLISNALKEEADFFISADIRYHEFFDGEGKMVIADVGHFESEQFTVDLLLEVILEKFPNFAVLKSGTLSNPVNYYI